MIGRLAGKRSIVAGAGQGIGETIARIFAGERGRVAAPFLNAATILVDGGRSALYHD